jgi:nascent polypeptide-associated complex subunit alpha
MMPGMGGMNPRQVQRMMQQMGIKNEEIKAIRVIIEKEGEKIVIEEPQVTLIDMQGQRSYQIAGKEKIESALTEEDVKMVAESANVSIEAARKALVESNGDIAEAIMKLEEK